MTKEHGEPMRLIVPIHLVFLSLTLALGCTESSGTSTPDGPDDPSTPNEPNEPDPPSQPDPQVPLACDEGFDFEDECDPVEFNNFAGGAASVVDNPDPSGINRTAKVVELKKFDDEVFGGSFFELENPVDWSQGTAFTMRTWAARPVDVLFKLEGLDEERSVVHEGYSTWQATCFEFDGSTDGDPATAITIIFDLGVVGKAATEPEKWTFYVDGIEQVESCPEPEPVEYELIFADEFNEGSMPNPATWNMETGYGDDDSGWGNNEWQLYTTSPDNVRVEDGNLVITALCDEPCGVRDGSVTSARLTTQDKFEFRYGRVEARIKPPVGEGAWPAFWALGANFPEIGWPRSGEIDFMEMHNAFSDDRTTHFTIHYCDEEVQAPEVCSFPEGHVFITRNLSFDESLGDDFQLFEAEWDETKIVGKINGIIYYQKAIDPEKMEEFQRDFFLILNVAMGGTLGSNSQPPSGRETFPQTMLVDYVRVYQRVD
jgi:beta-glucanase (GH16 family)